MGMRASTGQIGRMSADEVIRELAARQHGVVGRRQLLEAGVPVYAIDNRVRNRRLETLYRGVYRVGPLRDRLERMMAAVLACGHGAALSHRGAAALRELVSLPGPEAPVEVSTPGRHPAPRPDVRVYRVGALTADEITVVDGIPTTTPARTILDLAAVLTVGDLERVVARAERMGLVRPDEVHAVLARHARRAGTPALRTVLSRTGGAALTRSEAEALFLQLVRRARLPAPETNVRLEGFEVDFLWRRAHLVVEVDGFAFHTSPRMFERDRRRDRVLLTAGFNVMRVTLRDLTDEPEAVLVQVGQALVGGRA